MKKALKIFFKVIVGLFLFILIALIVVPLFFKTPILNKVKQELNKNLNARADFEKLSLNLLTGFPNLTVKLKGLYVVGLNDFEQDTLISLRSFSLSVNLMSLFNNNGYEIRSMVFDHPNVSAIVLKSGKANWDIAKSDSQPSNKVSASDTVETNGASPEIKVQLKKFIIRHARINYSDESSNMQAEINDLNFGLSGKLGTRLNQIQISSEAFPVTVKMDGIALLKRGAFKMKAGIEADLEKMLFTFYDNRFSINDLALILSGNIDMSGPSPLLDIRFRTSETSFKSLISLIPAIYLNDYQDLETNGNLSLEGFAKGTYNESDSTYPNIGLDLKVENAGFRYPALPKAVNNVNIDLKVSVAGDQLDKTTVDLNRFSMQLAENPFQAELHVETPVSDPGIRGSIHGNLNLSDFSDIIPFEDTKIKGNLNTAVTFDGHLSSIEKEQYNNFEASGKVALHGFEYNSPDLVAPLSINNLQMLFSSNNIMLSEMNGTLGNSDFQLKGRLDNYLMFVMKDEDLNGSFNLSSSLLNLNDFLSESAATTDTALTDTTSLSVVKVPSNIDFLFTSDLNKVQYGNLVMDHVTGKIRVEGGRIYLDGLSMNLLSGMLKADGVYDTSDTLKPVANMNLAMEQMDIPSAFNSFNTIKELVPFAKNLSGSFSMDLQYGSNLGSDMMPLVSTVSGGGNFHSKEIQIVSSNVFDQIKSLLKLNQAYTNTLKDLDISFKIQDGKVQVKPFDLRMGNIKMTISGEHGLDQSLNYLVKMKVPRKDLGSGANALMDGLSSQASALGLNLALSDPVPVNFKVTGQINRPKVSPGLGSTNGLSTTKEVVRKEIKKQIEAQKEKVKEQVQEKVSAEADKLIKQAEQEADHIKKVARETSERIKKEGYAQADSLENKAKDQGFLAKSLAKKAAEKLRQQSDKKAEALVIEADKKAALLLKEAQTKADGLKK